MQRSKTQALREVLKKERFVFMSGAYDCIGGRLVEAAGFPVAYNGGFVTGGSRAVSEPLLTRDEQVRLAGEIANSISIPVVADGAAGFGEPLHSMRTVREFIHAGVAGIHIEDQLYPKRAHYHKSVAHVIPREEFVAKIKFACQERDKVDPDFVVIARSDSCRFEGLDEAIGRVNLAAEVGADLGVVFPRDMAETERAPKISKLPLIYIISRGNRDGRPLPNRQQLIEMGYKGCIDAVTALLVSFDANRKALEEVYRTGDYAAMTQKQLVDTRQQVEDLVGLEGFYEIEEQTVEDKRWGKR